MKGRAIAVAGVGLSALLLAGVVATRNPAQAKPEAPAPIRHEVASVVSPGASLESIPRITATALREKIARGEVVVIDVRDADSFLVSHIPGALQIPLAYIDSEVPYLRGSKPIVTYCT